MDKNSNPTFLTLIGDTPFHIFSSYFSLLFSFSFTKEKQKIPFVLLLELGNSMRTRSKLEADNLELSGNLIAPCIFNSFLQPSNLVRLSCFKKTKQYPSSNLYQVSNGKSSSSCFRRI